MSEPTVDEVVVELRLSPRVAGLLETLAGGQFGPANLHDVLMELVDHAQQGVYRPGSWERPWLAQAFGEDFLSRLEPDTTDVSADGRIIFDRPVQEVRDVEP